MTPSSKKIALNDKTSKSVAAVSPYDEKDAVIMESGDLALPSGEELKLESTIEERLKAIQVAETNKLPKATVPKAESLQKMLVQALHTKDTQLLEECLNVNDLKVIQNTIQRLPVNFVNLFLKQVVARFQSKPTRGSTLAKWIKITLLVHMTYLMMHPETLAELSPLYQSIETRLQSFNKLLRIQGKLDALDQQIRLRNASLSQMESFNAQLETPQIVVDENKEITEEETDEMEVEEGWTEDAELLEDEFDDASEGDYSDLDDEEEK